MVGVVWSGLAWSGPGLYFIPPPVTDSLFFSVPLARAPPESLARETKLRYARWPLVCKSRSMGKPNKKGLSKYVR